MSNTLGRRMAILITAALLIVGPLAGVAAAAPPDEVDAVEIFAAHVYETSFGPLRNPTPETDPDELLYNLAGFNLGVTWGEWSAASATSRATRIGGPNGLRTDFRVSLGGLIPGGVYSLFYFTVGPDSGQPLCPGVERSLPLDATRPEAQLPDPNSFVVDPTGNADFHGRVDGDLLAAHQVVLTVVYHADGQTYYPFPNRGEFLTQGENCRSSFGHDAMRHLLVLQNW